MILNVPDMHCNMCVERINKGLAAAGINCEVNLDNKTVTVADADVAKAKDELDDLGFTAEE